MVEFEQEPNQSGIKRRLSDAKLAFEAWASTSFSKKIQCSKNAPHSSRCKRNDWLRFVEVLAICITPIIVFCMTSKQIRLMEMPSVGVVESKLLGVVSPWQDIVIKTTIKNTGNGPAKDWGFHMKPDIAVIEADKKPECNVGAANPVGVFVPGQQFSIRSRLEKEKLSPKDIENLESGKAYLFVSGRTDYSDSDGERYCLTICMKIMNTHYGELGFSGEGHQRKQGADCKMKTPP